MPDKTTAARPPMSHNQCVERHVKMVTEAAAQVEGFERRDGLIRQKIKSRKLLKKFDTKVQF